MSKISLSFDNPDNQTAQNFILRDGTAWQMPGTNRYNQTALTGIIRMIARYYGVKADGSFVKNMFVFSNGKLYLGNDVTGVLEMVKDGLYNFPCYPETLTLQVAGNSRMYFYDGNNYPVYYEGDDEGTIHDSSITYKFVQAVVKDDRVWGFEKNSSTLVFSRNLYPEDYSATYAGEIIIGNERDSFIRRIALLGNDLYIFKNDSIWVLRGSTKATYDVDVVIPNMGLLAQRALCMVGSAIVLVCQQDKEIYQFNGTPIMKCLSSKMLGNEHGFSDMLDIVHTDDIVCIWDMINSLFRLSYKNIETDTAFMNHEVIFPTNEANEDGSPKWSETKGARVFFYSLWDRQGDHTLVTSRSDLGYLEYHNRGSDWDEMPMECIIATDDIIPKDGVNQQFDSLMIRGLPSKDTIQVNTYLNSRHSSYSSTDMSDLGERQTLGSLSMSTQSVFNNWLPIPSNQNIGESICVEVYTNEKGKHIELDDLVIDYTERDDVQSALVGG
jgi:hypothetical protein